MTSVGNPHGLADSPHISSVNEPNLVNEKFNLEINESMHLDDLINFAETPPTLIHEATAVSNPSMCCVGNNLYFLSWMIQNGYKNQIACVYTDPPFGTAQTFVSSESVSSYSDKLNGGAYLEFQIRRMRLIHLLLREGGILYLHIDETMLFQLKLLLDTVFGKSSYLGMITRRKCSSKNSVAKGVGDVADYVLMYAKGDRSKAKLERIVYPWTEEYIKKEFPKSEKDSEGNVRKFKLVPVAASGKRNGKTGGLWRGNLPPDGKHWNPTPEKLDLLDSQGRIHWSSNGNPRKKVYLDESVGKRATNIVMDFRDAFNQNSISCGYPTEKNSDFVKMLIGAASEEGDIILDPFSGSGSTMVAASEIERKFIGIDFGIDAWRHYFRRLVKGEVLQKQLKDFAFLEPKDIAILESTLESEKITLLSDSKNLSTLVELLEQFNQLATE
jgi:adenine-specific DNA-methyltransferase